MFVLEESQLLEDTIRDLQVLEVYRLLRNNEHSNDRCLFRDQILSTPICTKFLEIMLEIAQANKLPVSEGTSSEVSHKIPIEKRAEISTRLNLEPSDVAPLALVVAATLTQLFVIDNFVGPKDTDENNSALSSPHILDHLVGLMNYRSLSVDASDVYHRTRNPWLLKCTELCWIILANLGISRKLLELEFLVWKQRYLTVHIMIFLEPPESCIKELKKLHEFIFDHHIINNDIKENKTQITRFDIVELCCELVQSSLLIDAITTARKICEFISEYSGITIEHTGVLGKRTKFQKNNIPQLVVKVQGSTIEEVQQQDSDLQLPKDIELEDDTLLPKISFVSSDGLKTSGMTKNLGIHAQLFMQARLDLALKSEVMEESLKDEWTLAYLRSMIEGASLWCLKYKTLHQRSIVEKKNMRKMDRALLQLEELINSCIKEGLRSSQRMRCFYSVLPLSIWQMQKSLADISLEMGLAKNALDLYSQIEFYEGMIKCLCLMEQTSKAEKIIRQELQKQETPYLYCLLGDVTEDLTHYEASWLLSKKRFARAKKSIGTHHYVRKQYTEAIDNYEAALGASPSNISILSMLAYCYLTLEQYDKAAEYYRRLTYLDDTSFLAWNNLSKAYIKLNQKERAWRTLREAIKCNYDEWKIWENFMVVSIELGAIDDVVTAWHRIIDIKSAHKDDKVLSSLTYVMVNRGCEQPDDGYMRLLNECLKLVARLISTSDCSPRTWLCYFRLLIKELDQLKNNQGEELAQLDLDSRVSKITNCLQRATPNATTADSELLQNQVKVDKFLNTYDEIVDCYGLALDIVGKRKELLRQWSYFKLSATNFLKALEKKGYRPAGK